MERKKKITEITSFTELDHWLADPTGPVAVQNVPLVGYEQRLSEVPVAGSLFLGCPMSDALAGYLVSHRAVVIPANWDFVFSPHRATLYRVSELFDGFDPDAGEYGNFDEAFDQKVFREYERQGRLEASIDVTLARRLHDHSITDARNEFVRDRRMVAIMGGHDLIRSDPNYEQIVLLARSLTRNGYTLASGGGPGAMEATHLGAYLAPFDDDVLDRVLEILSLRRGVTDLTREYTDGNWLQRAFRVREHFPLAEEQGATSLAIPTWFYGHEPPAPFATQIAKYFCNSVREDGLLQIARHGVIFAPGNAGTVQEIFQDAAQNYYRTFGHASPMILLNRHYWTDHHPAWELVQSLAQSPDRSHMRQNVHLVDTIDDVERIIDEFDPGRA